MWAIFLAVVLCRPQPSHAGRKPPPRNAASAISAEAAQGLSGLAEWRTQREMEISAPDGWLTLAGLEWLKSGVNSVGAAADNQIHLPAGSPDHLGLLTVSGKAPDEVVQLLSPSAGFPAELTTDGKPAREGSLVVDGARPTILAWHGITLVVLRRADRFVLRIKDAGSSSRTGFRGLKWYAPNPQYRVTARWVPFKPPQVLEIPTVIGTTLKLPAPGIAMFLLNGVIVHLEPVIEDPCKENLVLHPPRFNQRIHHLPRRTLPPHRPARSRPRQARQPHPRLQPARESLPAPTPSTPPARYPPT